MNHIFICVELLYRSVVTKFRPLFEPSQKHHSKARGRRLCLVLTYKIMYMNYKGSILKSILFIILLLISIYKNLIFANFKWFLSRFDDKNYVSFFHIE